MVLLSTPKKTIIGSRDNGEPLERKKTMDQDFSLMRGTNETGVSHEFDQPGQGGHIFLGPGLGYVDSTDLQRVVSFHGYLSSGAFIGMQVLALARRLLNIQRRDRIHVVCETANCLPDPFQVLAGCTIGNHGLIIRDTGKMAATITRHTPPGEMAPGVRIVLDIKKVERFEKLYAWYMNLATVPHEEVIEILRVAGEAVYSYDYVNVPVEARQKKRIVICSRCGEVFIRTSKTQALCMDCEQNTDT